MYATLLVSAEAGTTVKKLFCWVSDNPLGMILGQTVMKAELPLLVTELIERVTDLS